MRIFLNNAGATLSLLFLSLVLTRELTISRGVGVGGEAGLGRVERIWQESISSSLSRWLEALKQFTPPSTFHFRDGVGKRLPGNGG